jgi:hypothetical protein
VLLPPRVEILGGAAIGRGMRMHMQGNVRSHTTSGTRHLLFGAGHLNEKLLYLDEAERIFSSLHHEVRAPLVARRHRPAALAGDRRRPDLRHCPAIASPRDDVVLVPDTEQNASLREFHPVAQRQFGKAAR